MGKVGPTMKISLIFFECVRDEGTTDQLVIGGKMSGSTDTILPDNPSIQAEKNSPALTILVSPRVCDAKSIAFS